MTGIGDWFQATAFDGSLLLAVPVGIIAGLVSFFSSCVVPLLPGYLSYATGLSGADLESGGRGRMVLGSVLLVMGFSFVFVPFGALFGQLGGWLITYTRQISIGRGLVTILVGVAFLGFVSWMQRDVRVHGVPASVWPQRRCWECCSVWVGHPASGPTLTAVTSLAVTEASAGRGALLSLAYRLGLGVPLIVAGLAFRRMLGLVGWVRRSASMG